ncbi:uncharacterized protein LOC134719271 [Mytilus trossulus]|uniref:uncharacterized protein LOC134719271 n=1 Tax=Mytilus trossulus TaxID=6551 RepID=UPI003004E02B
MATSTLRKRYKEAQKVDFPGIEETSNSYIEELIMAQANAIGCPPEFLYFPFLTTTAGFMGSKSVIEFHEEWKEPAIIWTIIAASKGEKKSPALKRIKDAVTRIQDAKQKQWTMQQETKSETPTRNTKSSLQVPPQIIIDVFSMEEMHSVLLRNNYQVIGIYEEIKVLHQSLDIYKPGGSLVDRKQFLNLNGGSAWDRNFKNSGYSHLPRTHFNHTGMIQPVILAEMMDRDDWDGFNDRYLISCPKEVMFTSNMYKIPVPENLRSSMDKIFKVISEKHETETVYRFDEEAKSVFNNFHDNYYIEKKMQFTEDENRRGVLSKSLGYIIRLSGIITAVQNASAVVKEELDLDEYRWDCSVSAPNVKKAIALMQYFIDTKFALLPICDRIEEFHESQTQSEISNEMQIMQDCGQKIKRLLEFETETLDITSAMACRNALFPAVPKEQRGGGF